MKYIKILFLAFSIAFLDFLPFFGTGTAFVAANKNEAKHREEYLKKLSYARLSSLIKSKKIKGFTCHKEGEKTVICLKNGIYNLTDAILVKGENITFRGAENTVIQGCAKIDGWIDEGNGVFSARTEYDTDALYIDGEKYQMARFPKYNPDIRIIRMTIMVILFLWQEFWDADNQRLKIEILNRWL